MSEQPPAPRVPPTGPPFSFSTSSLLGVVASSPLYWLLLAIPVAVALKLTHAELPFAGNGVLVFFAACVAIIPLAGLMGRATENLAETMGAGVGGLLNATFGNAAELIIAVMFLWAARENPEKAGEMFAYVKASLTGSIMGNVLLVLGLSIFLGGLFHKRQKFNRVEASLGTTLLALASIGLIVPSLFYYLSPTGTGPGAFASQEERQSLVHLLSEEISFILAGVYVLSLLFSLRTHKHLFADTEHPAQTTGEHHQPEWSRVASFLVLVLATAGVAVMAEFLVSSVEQAAHAVGMNAVFVGVIVVAVIGNAAEHSTAVLMAMKNKMDLAFTIAVGSGIQIALFVAPVLVFISMGVNTGEQLDLHFTSHELMAVVLSILILAMVAQDGECHWMEGVLLLAVYVIFGMAFYHLPHGAH
jgi:Ca2+:H+ antiporter